MSAFKDADEVYAYIGKVFEIAVTDPAFVDATRGTGLVVLLTQTDPAATITRGPGLELEHLGFDLDGRVVAEHLRAGSPLRWILGAMGLSTSMGDKPELRRSACSLSVGSHRAGQPRCDSQRVVMWGRDRTGAASAGR